LADEKTIFALAAAERRRAADMFEGLTGEQWATPSLCAQWTVRDIAGHLVGGLDISMARFVAGSLIWGGMHRYNARRSRQIARRPTSELVAALRSRAEQEVSPPGTGPVAPLTDLAVHTRDAARPLGLPVTAADETWRVVLGFLVSSPGSRGFVPRGWLTGLRLAATDLSWSWGHGDEVAGTAEALALTGRGAALADLTGPGAQVLAARASR
jgi:uncharacterized protein (TIGR03083 family)